MIIEEYFFLSKFIWKCWVFIFYYHKKSSCGRVACIFDSKVSYSLACDSNPAIVTLKIRLLTLIDWPRKYSFTLFLRKVIKGVSRSYKETLTSAGLTIQLRKYYRVKSAELPECRTETLQTCSESDFTIMPRIYIYSLFILHASLSNFEVRLHFWKL